MEFQTTSSAILGRVIAKKRKEMGLDQASAADTANINRSSWSRIESGDMSVDIEQLSRIAMTLETTPEKLLSDVQKVRQELEKAGIAKVAPNPKSQKKSGAGWAMLAGAALGALIAAAASSAKNDDE